MSAVLDTHSAIWYFHRSKELSQAALQAIRRSVDNGQPVFISAISLIDPPSFSSRVRFDWLHAFGGRSV